MFRFSADQRHALEHGVQDFGKLTLAMLFLGGAISAMPLQMHHTDAKQSLKTEVSASRPFNTGLGLSVQPSQSQF